MKRRPETIEAESFLKQYEKLDAIIDNKMFERKQWQERAISITANMGGERVQSSGTMSRMADAVEECVDAEEEVLIAVRNMRIQKKYITDTIESLDSPMEYKILHDMYIKGMTHEEIAEKYNQDYSWSTTNHGRAMMNVWRLLHE